MNNENLPSTSLTPPLPPRFLPLDNEGSTRGVGTGVGHRMEWIDAMRGFTMLLVVAYHVSINGFLESPKQSFYLSSFVLFRMPLFFFISGFFSYSTKIIWSARTWGQLTWKKTRIQMLPTLIFFALYVVITRPNGFWDGCMGYLHNPTKGGYWFTYVLLLMFLIYYTYAYVESRFLPRLKALNLGWVPITLLWSASLVAYATFFMPAWFKYPQSELIQWSSFGQVIQFFHFFLAGNIVRRYWTQFQRLFDTQWFVPIVLATGTLGLCELFRWHNLHGQWVNLPRTLTMYALMTTVIVVFRHYATFFSRSNAVGRTLQYVGTRTLDIYLIHVLLIMPLPFVGEWLKSIHTPFVVDITLSFAGAAVITLICAILSHIIRTSPLLKYYLFGRK